jgi:hypothetical protein
MPKKRFGAERIVTLLCQIEVSLAQVISAQEVCLSGRGISPQNYSMSY